MLISFSGICQKKTYFSSGGEMILSFANIEKNGNSQSSTMRWAPVFNIQSMLNLDMSPKFGLFTGLALRNVGYIYGDYKTTTTPVATFKKKFRSYNIALPVGIKVGNLAKSFFYAGYEIELPVVYKEKTFDGGDKIDKITGWFSNRQELFQHGVMAGFQFPKGVGVKFKYYLSEFHNQQFMDGAGNKPYAGLKANIFYFSLTTFLFKDLKYDANWTLNKSDNKTWARF
jgi:hypothetical protein